MRWFKHYSDNHRGQSVQILLDELGYFGPFFYYLIYELCAEKLENKLDAELTPECCEFVFHQRVVCSASRAKPSTVRRALDAGQSCGLWTFSLDGFQIKISIPILLNLRDRDQKRPRIKRDLNALKTRLEKSRVEEEKSRVEYINTSEPKNSVTDVAIISNQKKFIAFKISENKTISLSQDLINSWAETFPKEFLDEEIKKARSWILANSHKTPKSNWSRFFNSWFNRAWETHRKTLSSNPSKMTIDQLESILGANNA